MGILRDFFKPAPTINAIEDEAIVKKEYKYWRIRIFYGMFIGYIFFYFTRKSYTFAMPLLMTDLGLDKAQLGILGSILYLTYGISKFVSGVMSDQSNPRFFMAIGLIITGVANILFGFSSSIFLFALFWGINGWFQGWGWPPCARLLTHWYSKSERGSWWSGWSTSHNVGGFLIPLLVAFCSQYYGWRGAMFLPGILCILMGFILMNRLRDTPQSLGLPPIEKWRNDYPSEKNKDTKEKELTTKEILFGYIFNNKWLWMLAFASFFVYIVRMAIGDWSALYLIEEKGYSLAKANSCVSLFEAGGLFGMLLAGWLSDKIHRGRRGPMNVIFSMGMLVTLCGFWWYTGQSAWIDSSILFMIGFFLFGPQMLIGLTAAELSHKKAAGTASGFAGSLAYFGAASAGYPLGLIAQTFAWWGYFFVLSICCILTVLLFLPMWNASANESSTPAEPSKNDDDIVPAKS